LLDTTLRDGAQTVGVTFTLHDKLSIAQKLDDLGVDLIEGGWPGSNPKDVEFFRAAKDLSLTSSRIVAFGSTRRKTIPPDKDPSLNAILKADVSVAAIFGKSWLLHVEDVLRSSAEQNLELVSDTVQYLKAHGVDVIFDAEHFFDGYKDSPEYALSVVRKAHESGAAVVVLCDTNGGTLTTELRRIVETVKETVGCPLGIHAHDDCGVAVANSLAAVEVGVRHVQGTFNGLGERCGNADLSQVIPNLSLKLGFRVLKGNGPQALRKLTGVASYIAELANMPLSPRHPYVGRNAFAHKGGVHIDAMLKNTRSYEHIDPMLVGNERTVSVSELAGRSALLYHAQKIGLQLSKDDVSHALEQVKTLEAEGYHLESADATLSLLVLRSIGREPSFFGVRTWWVEALDVGKVISRAVVSLDVGGETVTEVAEGVGPVHALDGAIRAALSKKFPELSDTRLVNYKVTVVDSSSATAAAVRVFVEFSSGKQQWATTSVSRNIVEASLKAIIDGYKYWLFISGGRR